MTLNRKPLIGCPPASVMRNTNPQFSSPLDTFSRTGVRGDPTVATLEKGEAWLDAAVKGLTGIIRDFGALEIRERVDHH